MNYAAHATSSRNQNPADYFYSAATHRSRGVLWPIFTPARISSCVRKKERATACSFGVYLASSTSFAFSSFWSSRFSRVGSASICWTFFSCFPIWSITTSTRVFLAQSFRQPLWVERPPVSRAWVSGCFCSVYRFLALNRRFGSRPDERLTVSRQALHRCTSPLP